MLLFSSGIAAFAAIICQKRAIEAFFMYALQTGSRQPVSRVVVNGGQELHQPTSGISAAVMQSTVSGKRTPAKAIPLIYCSFFRIPAKARLCFRAFF